MTTTRGRISNPLRLPLVYLWMAAAAAGQSDPQQLASWRGDYRFVHLAYSEGEKLVPVSEGGTLAFDGAGRVRFNESAGNYTAASATEGQLTLDGMAIDLRRNPVSGLLIGTAGASSGLRHHLLIGVRAAENVSAAAVNGTYGAAYFALGANGAGASGLITAYAQFAANGAGKLARLAVAGHAAGIDDVMRREDRPDGALELGADGFGVARFGTGSDSLNGDLRVTAAADGAVLLGWSTDEARPAVMVAVRKIPDAAVFSFRGRFQVAEVSAENSFVFQKSTRWSSSSGALASNSAGLAFLSQKVRTNGEATTLVTSNTYRAGSDGRHFLAPRGDNGIDNFAFNESAFVAAQTGAAGQLTLAHGLIFGIAAAPGQLLLTNAAAPAYAEAAVAPGALLALAGPGFAVASPANAPEGAEWPTELGGARVRLNGADAQIASVSPDRILFQCPSKIDAPGQATIEIVINGQVAHTLRAALASSSPGVITGDGNGFGAALASHADGSPVTAMKPAEPGETVTFTAVGLGTAASTLRVLVNGEPAEVTSTSAAPGQTGRHLIRVTVPRDLDIGSGGVREVPVALATGDSFTDLTDLVVMRRAQAAQ